MTAWACGRATTLASWVDIPVPVGVMAWPFAGQVPAPGSLADAVVPSVALLQKLALVIEILFAIETLEIAAEAPVKLQLGPSKLVASLLASAVLAEEPFALVTMDVPCPQLAR